MVNRDLGYAHVLVCIDLRSSKAQHLLHEGAGMLAADGRLSVLTVIEVGTFDLEREVVGSMIEEEYAVRSAHLERVCETAGLSASDQRVLIGKAPTEIAAYARDHGCDLVVLGQHEDRPSRPGLGSTTDAALRLVVCDALVVTARPLKQ